MPDLILSFSDKGWQDYRSLLNDKPTLKRVNRMIEETKRCPDEGIGRPKPLGGDLAGLWSKRVSDGDRMIYRFDDTHLYILALRGHYDDH